jgi:hypothetical protein
MERMKEMLLGEGKAMAILRGILTARNLVN